MRIARIGPRARLRPDAVFGKFPRSGTRIAPRSPQPGEMWLVTSGLLDTCGQRAHLMCTKTCDFDSGSGSYGLCIGSMRRIVTLPPPGSSSALLDGCTFVCCGEGAKK